RWAGASMRDLPLLRLAGDAYAIGVGHGQTAAAMIAHNLQVYFGRFAEEALLDRDEVLRRAERYWPEVRAQRSEFAAMVEGIATGARRPLLEIAALNLRFELLYAEFSRIGQADLGGVPAPAGDCTAFAVLPAASVDGHLWIGQNWDWIPDVAGLLLHVTRPDGLRVLCFTEAGIAGGKIGLNSAGVGLVVNGLLSNEDDWSRLGRPFHLRTWDVLCSTTLDGAVDAVTRGDRSCSANFLIGHAGPSGSGAAVDIETAPAAFCAHAPVAGTLAHANHFLEPDRLGIWQPIVEEKRSTYHRCARMERRLADAAARGPISDWTLREILRDHDGRPDSICRHPNPALPASESYETVVSVVMDLHDGRMQAASGPPCESSYQEFEV
ncbi:MAG: C45 family autoproteolytic acyltransferase/hydrolase, partial [Armatimonadota bacterium]